MRGPTADNGRLSRPFAARADHQKPVFLMELIDNFLGARGVNSFRYTMCAANEIMTGPFQRAPEGRLELVSPPAMLLEDLVVIRTENQHRFRPLASLRMTDRKQTHRK